MAEAGNFSQPVIGQILKALQFVKVQREDASSRQFATQAMEQRCKDPDGNVFMIFPEGVCTSGSHLVQFKDGAFRMGLPVQPVGIFYPWEKWCSGYDPKNPFDPAQVIPHILRCFFEFHNPMHVIWCPVYHPSEEEKKDAKLYANNVRAYLAKHTGKKLTEHAFEDVRLAMFAKRDLKVQDPTFAIVQTGKMYDALHFSFKDATKILTRCVEADKSKQGKVNITQFLEVLGLPRNALTEQVFSLYDASGDGLVDFREYLAACAVIRGVGAKGKADERPRERLDFAWQLLTEGAEGKATLELQDFSRVWKRYGIDSADAIKKIFDEAKGDKLAMDREAFDAFMRAFPEYLQVMRMGEKAVAAKAS